MLRGYLYTTSNGKTKKEKVKLTDINLGVSIGATYAGKILQFEKKIKIKKESAIEIPYALKSILKLMLGVIVKDSLVLLLCKISLRMSMVFSKFLCSVFL